MAQQDDALPERRNAWVGFDRRRGQRRHAPEDGVEADRRHADRRRRRPGIVGLLGAILGVREDG